MVCLLQWTSWRGQRVERFTEITKSSILSSENVVKGADRWVLITCVVSCRVQQNTTWENLSETYMKYQRAASHSVHWFIQQSCSRRRRETRHNYINTVIYQYLLYLNMSAGWRWDWPSREFLAVWSLESLGLLTFRFCLRQKTASKWRKPVMWF